MDKPHVVLTRVVQDGPDHWTKETLVMDVTPQTSVAEIARWYWGKHPRVRDPAHIDLSVQLVGTLALALTTEAPDE